MFDFQTQRFMRFDVPRELEGLAASIPGFLSLVDAHQWRRRVDQLARDCRRTPFLQKIVADYHWLEMELDMQMAILREHGRLIPQEITSQSMAALQFAATTVEVAQRLDPAGNTNLRGRLRDSIRSGFAGLYLEMDTTLSLLDHGFHVQLPDLGGLASYDLLFQNDAAEGEVECKSVSADAGRKIHRRDFYRFADGLTSALIERMRRPGRDVLLITLDDRLDPATAAQAALRSAVLSLLEQVTLAAAPGSGFLIERLSYDEALPGQSFSDSSTLHSACKRAFGHNCHATGLMDEKAGSLIVMRSRREDDHSKPQLEALKKAASQLSAHRPGFIAVQYEDVQPQDLTLPHLRERAAILANALFCSANSEHLVAVHHSAYDGLHLSGSTYGKAAFVVWNPRWQGPTDSLPFRTGISDSDFAAALGLDAGASDSDNDL